jgi:hypothetical protein
MYVGKISNISRYHHGIYMRQKLAARRGLLGKTLHKFFNRFLRNCLSAECFGLPSVS